MNVPGEELLTREMERRVAEAAGDEATLEAIIEWLIDAGLPSGTARMMVVVEDNPDPSAVL